MVARGVLRILLAFAIWGALLFGSAGTVSWPRAWIHLALWAGTFLLNLLVLLRVNLSVLRVRMEREKPRWTPDTAILLLLLVPTLALPVVAGLDAVRHGWTSLGSPWVPFGIVLHLLGNALVLWTMAVNPYLARTMRIQEERGHEVITTGPYAFVRHPMYVGGLGLMAAIPLVLGSLWSFAPLGAIAVLLLVRTALEDAALKRNLPGYVEYAARTRYRLLPGVW
jgi:protein-S-isoprenylcysteine O-methyltransferase Ste14